MNRYYFLAGFETPQDGPDLMPVHPFDKVEVVQGDKTVYPESPGNVCIVSVECQEHTRIADHESDEPLWPSQRALMLAPIESAMAESVKEMSETHAYLGMEVL